MQVEFNNAQLLDTHCTIIVISNLKVEVESYSILYSQETSTVPDILQAVKYLLNKRLTSR